MSKKKPKTPPEELKPEAAPKPAAPRPPTEAEYQALALLEPARYDRVRKNVADAAGIRVTTLDDEILKRRKPEATSALTFADVEPWIEPVNGADLLDSICAEIDRYLIMPKASRDAAALWIVLTWALSATFIFPMIAISSPQRRCGKSTLLILLRKMCRKPLLVSNTSAAAIFRTIEKYSPTLLLDEAETWSRENEELRGILNCGHSRDTAGVLRVEGDNFEPRVFNCYCPKALAGIGRLADTIEDRSILVKMQRRAPNEPVTPLRQDRLNLDHLQRKCARWSADNLEAMCSAEPAAVPSVLHDRAADNWRPLLRIADLAGNGWPARARAAAVLLTPQEADNGSIPALLLGDIHEIFAAANTDRMRSVDLATRLAEIEIHPWAEWGRQRKPISVVQLARQLAPFGIQPNTVRFQNTTAKGYELDQFADAFMRYLPPTAKTAFSSVTPSQAYKNRGFNGNSSVTTETCVTDPNRNSISGVAAQNGENTEKNSGCDGVTDQTPKKLSAESESF